MRNPHDSTTPPNWVPCAFAAAALFAGYVVGPLIGRLLATAAARTLIAVDDALADLPTIEGAP